MNSDNKQICAHCPCVIEPVGVVADQWLPIGYDGQGAALYSWQVKP